MTAIAKENMVSVSVNPAFVDGIGVSVSCAHLSVFGFSRDMALSRFF
jgi:hypothetical protein